MSKTPIPECPLVVHEILLTLQGESTRIGRLCTLIRLAGCPNECTYCDTPQARSFDAGDEMTIETILERVDSLGCRLVEITGGEPLAQPASADLARALIERGYEVLIETSGCLPIDNLPAEAIRIMDLKCPGSGECENIDWSNLEHLTERDEIKFVIADHHDYEWAFSTVREHHLNDRARVLFSPAAGMLEPSQLAEWIIDDRLDVTFQMQLHKCIWGMDARSV